MTIPLRSLLPDTSSCQPDPPWSKRTLRAVSRKRDQPRAGVLFGIAPGGACRAAPVASGAVGSYPTVSSLPCMHGGLFSVALSVGLPRPGVTRHRCFVESGLSSGHECPAAIRPSAQGACGISSGAGQSLTLANVAIPC